MKRRLLMSLVAAGIAVGTAGVASANPTYWRDNGLLLEVSADPRDGNDVVQVNPQRADRLELVALNARVDLRGIVVRFADGRSFHTHVSGVTPGQPMNVDLPANCGTITSVELAYIRPELRQHDRTAARLQIVPRMTRGYGYAYHADHDHVGSVYQPAPTYTRAPTYTYQAPVTVHQAPRYQYRPRRTTTTWSGSIQGSFRF